MVGLVVLAGLVMGSLTYAGPLILGGDDLTDHGSRVGGVNLLGWKYIENATGGILAGVTRPGATGIAVLGATDSTATSGNAGAAMHWVGVTLGKTVTYHDGAAAITTFFANLASGAINPKMLHIVGTGAANDLVAAEGVALTANAAAIAAFVASGGGVLAHGSGTTAYGWLSVLIPGLIESSGCSTPVTLTTAGVAAFPGVSNADVSAGPCHSSFSGSLGSLSVLATDGTGRNVIIGGGANAVIGGSPAEPVPTVGVWGTGTLLVLLMMMGLLGVRKRRI